MSSRQSLTPRAPRLTAAQTATKSAISARKASRKRVSIVAWEPILLLASRIVTPGPPAPLPTKIEPSLPMISASYVVPERARARNMRGRDPTAVEADGDDRIVEIADLEQLRVHERLPFGRRRAPAADRASSMPCRSRARPYRAESRRYRLDPPRAGILHRGLSFGPPAVGRSRLPPRVDGPLRTGGRTGACRRSGARCRGSPAAARSRSWSASVVAPGFSRRTCLPASSNGTAYLT